MTADPRDAADSLAIGEDRSNWRRLVKNRGTVSATGVGIFAAAASSPTASSVGRSSFASAAVGRSGPIRSGSSITMITIPRGRTRVIAAATGPPLTET